MYEKGFLGFKSPRIFKNGNSTPNSSAKSFKQRESKLKLAKFQNNQQYRPQKEKIVKNSVYYDSTRMKDSSFHNSVHTNQSQESLSLSRQKSLRQSQYSISGFYNERKKYQHQIMILNKQIQKLTKQIESKDRQINQFQQNKAKFKQIQMELIQTYRVINYYEGKIKQFQKLLMYHQKILVQKVGSRANTKLKEGLDFKEIIQFFRNESIQIKGQLQKSNHQNTKLSNKIFKMQAKYNNLQKSFSDLRKKDKKAVINQYQSANLHNVEKIQKITTIYQKRLQNSQQKISLRRGDDQVSVSSSIRSGSSRVGFKQKNKLFQSLVGQDKLEVSKMYGNFNSKINKIEKQLDYFKIENQKIQNELNQKIIEMGRLVRQNDELKYLIGNEHTQNLELKNLKINLGVNYKEEKDPLNRVTILPYDVLQGNKQQRRNDKNNDSIKKNYKKELKQSGQQDSGSKRKTELKNMSLNQISKKIIAHQTKKYTFKQILPQTIRKLRFNLIREDITYNKLLQTILQKLVQSNDSNCIIQTLQDTPYQLNSQESATFLFQFKKIQTYLKQQQLTKSKNNNSLPDKDLSKQEQTKMFKEKVKQILIENIQFFRNITLRRDASLTAQLTKTFKNRLSQLQPYLKDKKRGLIQFKQAQLIFRQQWHLSEQEIQFIFLKSCQESEQFSKFDFYKTIYFFIEN